MDRGTTDRKQRPRRQKSLLARALDHLARREHSRAELARKLAPHAESLEQLDALLQELQAKNLLSDARFVDALARQRSARFGAARVKQELRTHGVDDELLRSTVAQLRQSELERAKALWQRRFGEAAADPAGRARQARFLAGRGFSSEVIAKLVRGALDEDPG